VNPFSLREKARMRWYKLRGFFGSPAPRFALPLRGRG